ncbi:MAG TPA: DUF2203 domain-containing protein [Candidatus Eisenbacteria bacterium]
MAETNHRKGGIRITLFTVDEANQLLKWLRPTLERLVELKREFDRIQRQVDVLGLAASGASPRNPDALALAGLERRRLELGEELGRGVQAVHRRGVVLKDLDRGLVDFYTVSGDRLIFLCWQLSEPEVAHWHTLEGGFAGRLPLDRSELE